MRTRENRAYVAKESMPTLNYYFERSTNYFELCETAINQLWILVDVFSYKNPKNGGSASRNLYYYLLRGYKNLTCK